MNLGLFIKNTRIKKMLPLRAFLIKTKICSDYLRSLEKETAPFAPKESSFYFLIKRALELTEEEYEEMLILKENYKQKDSI